MYKRFMKEVFVKGRGNPAEGGRERCQLQCKSDISAGGRRTGEEEPQAVGYFKDILVRKMGSS